MAPRKTTVPKSLDGMIMAVSDLHQGMAEGVTHEDAMIMAIQAQTFAILGLALAVAGADTEPLGGTKPVIRNED